MGCTPSKTFISLFEDTDETEAHPLFDCAEIEGYVEVNSGGSTIKEEGGHQEEGIVEVDKVKPV